MDTAHFEYFWVMGLLPSIAEEQRKKVGTKFKKGLFFKNIDVDKLKAFYTAQDCAGMDALIDALQTPSNRGLVYFGSGSIRLAELIPEKIPTLFDGTVSFYVGDRTNNISPLQWLVHLARGFEKVPPKMRPVLGRVAQSLADMLKATANAVPANIDEIDELPKRSLSDIVGDLTGEPRPQTS